MMDANLGDGCLMMPTKEFESIDLPPGFRFHPTDEEIITHYLSEKVVDVNFFCVAIGEVDLNKNEPWDLPSKATMGEKEWYFFCQKDRKYPTGMRTNRATESGYWKATGKDKEIFKGKGCLVGMKKTLVFYKGRAPKGEKTNWVMHEYRLEGKASHSNFPRTSRDEWAVCRVFHKTTGLTRPTIEYNQFQNNPTTSSYGDDQYSEPSTLPPLMESPYSMGTTSSYGEPKMMNTSMDQYQQNQIPNYYNTMASSSNFYPQNNTFNMDYSHHGQVGLMNTSHNSTFDVYDAPQGTPSPLRRHCKVEQYSNQPETSYHGFNNGQVSTPETSTTLEEFNSLLKY